MDVVTKGTEPETEPGAEPEVIELKWEKLLANGYSNSKCDRSRSSLLHEA